MKDEPAGSPPGPPAPSGTVEADRPREQAPKPDASPPAEEMGGEAPCQLHRFWDVEE